ncbi:aminotransferase class I/II-fold pyridoxal phosphate-dependent enzyme [Candidatus Woesearchaeota archaeon]|nr:aminotransferase class I/II-fold pyridoxal phosphate-dependent enzyme [Candidatus Woesearchaeota archaeon]
MTEVEKVISKLKEYTRHDNARLVNCGNAAIFAAIYILKKVNSKPFILVPDQGGWISFKTYPKIFGFEVKGIKTDKGVIDLKDLEENAKKGAGLFITSFAGYYAEQPLKQISEICRKHGCILIEDATGAIGDSSLCNGNYSDIIVGSFGKWKPVNFYEGGFISCNDSDYLEKTKEMYSILRFKPDHEKLLQKLDKAKERLNRFMEISEKIKSDLEKENLNIFHRDKRGLNVIVGFKSDEEKEKIIEYCKKNKYEFLVCPKEIRVNEDAISIEVKRL